MAKSRIFSIIIFVILIIAPVSYSANFPVTVKMVFPYFQPDTVMINGVFTDWKNKLMAKVNDTTFQFNGNDLAPGQNYIFYSAFKLFPYYDSNYIYISTSYKNLSRIIYTKIYINDQLLNSSYVWGDNNLHFSINEDGSIHPAPNPVNQNIDDRIPPEVHWPYAYIHFPGDAPDTSQKQVTGWVQVLHDNNYSEQSKIEIDYVKLYARTLTQDTLLDSTNYYSFNQVNDGGLYIRYPFFPPGFDEHDPMPATTINGFLTFYPDSKKFKVWHFWNPEYPRAKTDTSFKSYWFEVRYRITGKACIQIGLDFRNRNDSVTEGGVSNWEFESTDGLFHTLIFDTKHPTATIIESNSKITPGEYYLFQNYPNPFNPNTTIKYWLKSESKVSITIYNLLGQKITTLLISTVPGGYHLVNFNAGNLASGIYLYRITALSTYGNNRFTDTKKLILMK